MGAEELQERYRQAVVSYIDILGFKQLVEESQQDSNRIGDIEQLLHTAKEELAFNPIRRQHVGASQPTTFIAYNFSDLTVRARFTEVSSREKQVFNELEYLAATQMALLVRDQTLIRGGVCHGEILGANGIIFGPGLVRAYVLESEYAVYPRIVVDREIAHAIIEQGDVAQNTLLTRGEDGAYFVDYLFSSVVFDLLVNERKDGRNRLIAHRDAISSKILKLKEKPARVKQKLLWLALYHNATLERLKEHPHTSHIAGYLEDVAFADDQLRF